MKNKDRPTIGVLTSVIDWWWYGNDIYKGIISSADEKGVNIRFFTGGRIDSPNENERYENAVYKLADKQNVDGIIAISAGLCECITHKRAYEFFSGLGLPVVGIGDFGGLIPQILVDNKSGMRSMIKHLTVDRGYRKIAYISGPELNSEARIRLAAYKEVLEEQGIEVNPDYIVYGSFTWSSSKKLVKELLDIRKLDIQAIACANDDTAFGAYYELNARSIEIPGTIAITGFDDVNEAGYMFPPLTTVKQPFFEQGSRALSLLLDLILRPQDHLQPENIMLPARLIVRKSCGSSTINKPAGEKNRLNGKEPVEKQLERVADFDKMLSEWPVDHYFYHNDRMKKKVRLLYQDLIADLKEKKNNHFHKSFKKILSSQGITEEKINLWHHIITLFTGHIKNSINDTGLLKQLLDMQTRTFEYIKTRLNSIIGKRQVESDIRTQAYKLAAELLGPCVSFEELLTGIKKSLERAGLDSFYLSFYPEGSFGYPDSSMPVKKGRLFLGFDGEKIVTSQDNPLFPIKDLVPGGIFKYKKKNHFVIYPLTYNGIHFGIIVMEYFQDKIQMYHPLVSRFNSSLGTLKQFTEIENTVRQRTKELEQANNKLEETNEKLKQLDSAKTDFVANISHELRTPLTLILGPLESLISGTYGNPIKKEHSSFKSMHANSVRLLRLINTLLDFSKLEAGRMKLYREKTNINKLLRFYISSIYSGIECKGLSIEFIDCKEQLVLPIDRNLIEKAFFNLISNALKFSPPGETITISLTKTGREVLIAVKDRGMGIPGEKLETIFDRFTQVDQTASRSYEGTGIGLSFAKEIIELHRGTISVESRPGEGSVFTIRLPYQDKNQQCLEEEIADFREVKNWLTADLKLKKGNVSDSPLEKRESKPENREQNEYILIVDDNSNIRNFIRELLENKYRTGTAPNGEEALKKIEDRLPDLIISDVMMPVMDGLELCRRLKTNEKTSQIPLILLTARMEVSTRIEGLEQKADDYLLKPFNARELFARIENLLEKHRLQLSLKETTNALWSEMETARQIQTSLLPKNPVLEKYRIACYIRSASEVSGDYYDVIREGDKSWLVIGDVSGHGITAGLVMMMVQTAINTLVQAMPGISPAKLLSLINRTIKNNIRKLGQEKYMTIMVFALIEKGECVFSGLHQDILIYRAEKKSVEVIESKGMWIGFMDDISHLVQNDTLKLNRGDTLLLYTDGITEAVKKQNSRAKSAPGRGKNRRFGNEKLLEFFRQNGGNPPDKIKAALIEELSHYICDDDFTFMIVQRK